MHTILLDLDGTLITNDTNKFMKTYMEKLYPRLEEYSTLEEFKEYMKKCIDETIKSTDKNKYNDEVFKEALEKYAKCNWDKIYNEIMLFYQNEYKEIDGMYSKNKYMLKCVKLLKKKGYKLVVATNAVFPKSALIDRLLWGGYNIEDFDLITSIEYMNFCKPNVEYYSQILEILNIKSEECMMVGNDVQEDMVASKLGIKTYLVTDNLINRTGENPNCTYKSTSEKFYDFVKSMPSIH